MANGKNIILRHGTQIGVVPLVLIFFSSVPVQAFHEIQQILEMSREATIAVAINSYGCIRLLQ